MEQHAIPQQISSYQFRLVGDMTLKQFFQLAGGLLVSLLFYATKLHPLIKWPFIVFFALLGVALAFLPFEERPLEKWIIAFFRSIYTPTLFSWAQPATPQKYYQDEPSETQQLGIITPATQKAQEGFVSPTGSSLFSKFENTEKNFLSSISQLFNLTSPKTNVASPLSPTPTPKQPLAVPVNLPTQFSNTGFKPKYVTEEKAAPAIAPDFKLTAVKEAVVGQQINSQQAKFSIEASPPNPPTQPNTVVGQVFDTQGKIVNGAILEIRDSAGRPVRALRSNMLGHFVIVTPLLNGRYQIITEREGLSFTPVSFEATGAIIPPIAISASSVQKIYQTIEVKPEVVQI